MAFSFLKRMRDPISGLTHLAGALLGVFALIYLLERSAGEGTLWHVVSFSVFGASLILLYSSSAFYHLLDVSDEARLIFRRIDHVMIFVLIAGSYTPFCLVPLRGPWGWSLFAVVWGLAFVGVFLSIYWIHAPRWISTSIYLGMGWLVVVAAYPLSQTLNPDTLWWLVLGGVAYSLGAVIYVLKWPDPFPPVFGFHEVWHLFVLAGSTCHFFGVVSILG